MRFLFSCLFLIAILAGCGEPDLDLNLDDYEPRIVVDGSIENGRFPTVAVTRSVSYLQSVDQDDLLRASELSAKVTVIHGQEEEILTQVRNTNGFPTVVYTGRDIKGVINETYFLKVEVDGEIYEAKTTIPEAVPLDSIWLTKDESDAAQYILNARLSDASGAKNFYRVFTRRLGKDDRFFPMYVSTIADDFFDGKSLDFTIFRGVDNIGDTREQGYFNSGEEIVIRFASIDEPHFDFWSTLEREIYSFANPFSASGNEVKHNLSGGAIGVWGGYGVRYYTIQVP